MQVVIWCIWALVIAMVVFGVFTLVTGGDPALEPAEPDGVAVPLPGSRPLVESDVQQVRFDLAFRGYRMAQVDTAMRRAAYDIGYKDELIAVLQAEVAALRDGRSEDADQFAAARGAAAGRGPEPKDLDDPAAEPGPTTPPQVRAAHADENPDDEIDELDDDVEFARDDEPEGAEAALEDGFGARSRGGAVR